MCSSMSTCGERRDQSTPALLATRTYLREVDFVIRFLYDCFDARRQHFARIAPSEKGLVNCYSVGELGRFTYVAKKSTTTGLLLFFTRCSKSSTLWTWKIFREHAVVEMLCTRACDEDADMSGASLAAAFVRNILQYSD